MINSGSPQHVHTNGPSLTPSYLIFHIPLNSNSIFSRNKAIKLFTLEAHRVKRFGAALFYLLGFHLTSKNWKHRQGLLKRLAFQQS